MLAQKVPARPLAGGTHEDSTRNVLQGEVKDDDFRNYFEQFGEIDDCVVST